MERKLIKHVCNEMAEITRLLIKDTDDKKYKKQLWKKVKVFRGLANVKYPKDKNGGN